MERAEIGLMTPSALVNHGKELEVNLVEPAGEVDDERRPVGPGHHPARGFAIPTEESFDRETGPHGPLYVGSPATVAQKITANLRALGVTRFDLKYGMPGMTHDQLMTAIELYGQHVISRVRELLS